jgi:biopolymer transport protein ExbD
MRRRRKRRLQSEVELNLAAMLDMAFQLLAFFVLTFRSPPLEGQISLRLPPPQAVVGAKTGQAPGEDQSNKNLLKSFNTLTISVFADAKTGSISSLAVGAAQVPGLAALEGRLKEVFTDQGNPFDQVIIQVSDSCRYDELMKVIDICTRQKLADGKKLSKLSFVELPSG